VSYPNVKHKRNRYAGVLLQRAAARVLSLKAIGGAHPEARAAPDPGILNGPAIAWVTWANSWLRGPVTLPAPPCSNAWMTAMS